MKKVLLALCVLISVDIHAMQNIYKMNRQIKMVSKLTGLKPGETVKFDAKRLLNVRTRLRDNTDYKTYYKLQKNNGEIVAQGTCPAHVLTMRTPSQGEYLLTVSHNKKLKKEVSEFLTAKYGKPIKSIPLLFKRLELIIK